MNQRVITVQVEVDGGPERLARLMDRIVGSALSSDEDVESIACFRVIKNDGLFTAIVVVNTVITVIDSPE